MQNEIFTCSECEEDYNRCEMSFYTNVCKHCEEEYIEITKNLNK